MSTLKKISPGASALWDINTAIERITNDGLLNTVKIMNEPDWVIRATLSHTAMSRFDAMARITGFITIAVELGEIKNPDTPVNWIAWAERKGYNTNHLECFKDIQKHEPVTDTHKKINEDTGNYKESREHELHSLIKKVFTSLNSPKSNIVWNTLKDDVDTVGQERKYDKEEIIQEMDRKTIYWSSRRRTERKMTRETFDNCLSRLRNS